MFDRITAFDNLLAAYFRARRNKRFRPEVQKVELTFENRLLNLQRSLQKGSYHPQKYRRFLVHEPKLRQVSAPAFIDRVVHQAIVAVVEPVFDELFIANSFACRRGKGTLFALSQVNQCYQTTAAHNPIFFALKCDIKSYFASINQATLLSFLRQVLSCPRTLALLKTIITSYQDEPGTDIPIGNLTSQLFANVYLHPLDCYITRTLKEPNYFRYMDDFLILSPDINYLKQMREKIRVFLEQNLKLKLHAKKANIFRADRGLDFVGYLMKPNQVTLRKKTLRRYKRRHRKRLKQLIDHKNALRAITRSTQLSFLENPDQDIQTEKLKEEIQILRDRIKFSRNSFKGFLNRTCYQRLDNGAVNVGGILVPKIFPKR
jgi:RNA-directed DNA polymerase